MRVIPSDERVIDENEVFAAFDYTYPGLEAVGNALEEKDTDKAKQLLVDYFRTRENVKHFYDYRGLPLKKISENEIPFSFQASLGLSEPIKQFSLYAGNKLMDNIYVMPGSNRGQVDLGPNLENEIHYDFYKDQKKCHRGTLSIFSRGQFFEYLAFLYHETGDKAVVAKYSQLLDFFFEKYPLVVEDFSISAGHLQYSEDRDVMNLSWLGFVYVEMLYCQITYELDYHQVFELIKHLWFVVIQLRRYDEDTYRPYNHHFFERGISPFFFGVMFPEIPDFVAMKQRGAQTSLRHIKEDLNLEGGYNELSIAYWYGAAIAEMLYRLVTIAKINNEELLDEDAFIRIDKTFSLFSYLVTTGSKLPSIGDNAGPLINPILQLASVMTENKECIALYNYRTGISKELPNLVKYYANDKTGFALARSSCEEKANGFIMSAKVNCGISGHNHMDMLSLIIRLRGVLFASEPYAGRLYHSVKMKSIQRGYMYNMDSHNTVLCYGEAIQPWNKYANRFGVYRPDSPITEFSEYENGMYVSAYHYGYTFCSHTRKVLFCDNGSMLVRDEVNRGDRLEENHIQRWNFEPGVVLTKLSSNAVLLTKDAVKYLWVWDNASDINIFKQSEILLDWFTEEEIGYTLDVSFTGLVQNSSKSQMLVILNTLMLDVSDTVNYDLTALISKSSEIGSAIATKDAYDKLWKI